VVGNNGCASFRFAPQPDPSLNVLQADQRVCRDLLADLLPKLSAHLERLDVRSQSREGTVGRSAQRPAPGAWER
jgi:hypothetical protein